MRKLFVCVGVCLITAFAGKPANAGNSVSMSMEMRVASHIHSIYDGLDFTGSDILSYDAFAAAYKGYLNLKEEGKLNDEKQILTVCDFNLPSSNKRMWIIDLQNGKILFNTFVAHGMASGGDYATSFSNSMNSHQSSLGFYVTGDTYNGEHGTSLRLNGMDQGFNSSALARGVVVHGARYVCDNYVNNNTRLGRSWGCPAVPDDLKEPIINTIKAGTCLFIYRSDKKYANSSRWLNNPVSYLPQTNFDELVQVHKKAPQTTFKVQYVHNGKVDSVKSVGVDFISH